jgi:DNA-binding IclR family transcriptional regulator
MELTPQQAKPLARAWRPFSSAYAWRLVTSTASRFSVAKVAAYMRVPRTTIIRRLNQLQRWGLIDREGRRYYMHEKKLNSLIGMRSYEQVREILSKATQELTDLDALPD